MKNKKIDVEIVEIREAGVGRKERKNENARVM